MTADAWDQNREKRAWNMMFDGKEQQELTLVWANFNDRSDYRPMDGI